MTLYEKMESCINANAMLNGATGVVLALSGGADSMALLSYFIQKKPLPFCAAHVNHCLREQADADESFVKEYCKQNGVLLFTKKIDVGGTCPRGVSVETYARTCRYEFFNEVREKTGYSHIATAHNADDNLETLFMNIIRGCGLSGLTAIPYIRSDMVIRPLIEASKAEIYIHCKQSNVPYVVDQTNFESICTRNILRNEIIPLIKKINPSVENTPLISLAKTDLDYICGEAKKVFKAAFVPPSTLLLPPLKGLHNAVLYEVLRMAAEEYSHQVLDFEHTLLLAELVKNAKTSAKTELGGGIIARVCYDRLELFKKDEKPLLIKPTLLHAGKNEIDGLGTVNVLANTYSSAVLRSRKQGDAIKTAGGTKSLKKLFIDKKIPFHLRGLSFVVEAEGEIVFVYGIFCKDKMRFDADLEKSNI